MLMVGRGGSGRGLGPVVDQYTHTHIHTHTRFIVGQYTLIQQITEHHTANVLGIGSAFSTMASTPPSRGIKKPVLLALLAGVLVVGAIFGGVFGGRAAQKKRRVPIPVEAMTYSMVAEGFVNGAVVPVPNIRTNTAATSSQNATTTATTTTTTTADKAPAGTGLGGEPPIFSFDYWFGQGGVGAIPMFDPTPLILPPGAVTVPTWSAALASGNFANGDRVVCYAKTGQDVMDMVSGDESACEVVILTNDRFTPYAISQTLNITKPKLLLGRPVYAPMLNCTNHIIRLFDGKSVGLFFCCLCLP